MGEAAASIDFRRFLLQELGGLELTLLRDGEVVGHYLPSVNEKDGQFWLAYRAAIAEVRIAEALAFVEGLAEVPPVASTRTVKDSWPEIRGAIEWSRYTRALARGGPAVSIPYWTRHLSPTGPELVVLVATLAMDVAVIRTLLGQGLAHRRGLELDRSAGRAALALSRRPLSELYSVVRTSEPDIPSLVPLAVERLERGRAWSPGAPALYRWIVKWFSAVGEQERLREVLLRGEGLDDSLFELWCTKRLASAMAEQIGVLPGLECYPVFERYRRGYSRHGEIFAFEVPTRDRWTELAGTKVRFHFQRAKGVLSDSRVSWGDEPSRAWVHVDSGAGLGTRTRPARLNPDLVVSIGETDENSRLTHFRPPVIADSKNRQGAGSDERLKMLGYLHAFSHYSNTGRIQAALTFIRKGKSVSSDTPALFLNDVRTPTGSGGKRLRSVKAVYEFVVEPGDPCVDQTFQSAADLVLRRIGLRGS